MQALNVPLNVTAWDRATWQRQPGEGAARMPVAFTLKLYYGTWSLNYMRNNAYDLST